MSGDSWDVSVDVQEASTARSQLDCLKKVDPCLPAGIREADINGGGSAEDPSSPLFSVKTFEELRLQPELLRGVTVSASNRPSRIQENALPMMLAQPPQNLIAQSQSGTGKTAAFSLAMLSHVKPENHWTQCLCIAPTYELALQIGQVMEQMGKFCPEVTLTYAVRGNRKERGVRLQQHVVIWTLWYINIYNISVAPQRRGACACSSTWSSGPSVERGVRLQQHVVIGTPGTLLDWCSKYRIIDPKLISMFVLDEADVMIATQGHRDQSIRIHRESSPDPNIIRLREEETLDTIKQFYILCREEEEKFSALCDLYGGLTVAQAMIFCRDGKEKVLVTTNVCSRGIDVEQVTWCVNFDLPVDMEGNADNETYLHRIGRTGRFGAEASPISRLDPGNLQEMELLIS
ncbi:hypothetical protein F7725_001455 [Dissostichus mawsoni]|uniref:RNA helicase n=1 Tax=Dissostichus mawsoni TaxID=36200 RepID=A0A7J5ZHT4_DISMA|nr:hypothetical protein F7725_001455 [Dissostichus mawsoni]